VIDLYSYPKDFVSLNRIIAHLRKNEALNNKVLDAMPQCKSSIDGGILNDSIIYTAENEKILNVTIIIKEKLFLSGATNTLSINLMIDWVIGKRKQIKKILGPKDLVSIALSKLSGMNEKFDFEISLETYLMELTALKDLSFNKAHFRLALKKDFDAASTLVQGFLKEALAINDKEFAKQKTQQLIEQNQLHLLEVGGNIVSIAVIGRNLQKTAAISYVYTPLKFRKKGYATNCVYQLSELILNKMNKHCILFADKHNQQSQKIYQKLGYQTIMEFQEVSVSYPNLAKPEI